MSHVSCYHRYSQVSTDSDNLVMVVLRRAKCIAPCISSMYDHLWDHDNIHTVVYIYTYIYVYNVLYMIYDVCLYVCCSFFSWFKFCVNGDGQYISVCFRHCFMDRRIVLWCWWEMYRDVIHWSVHMWYLDVCSSVHLYPTIWYLFRTYNGTHSPIWFQTSVWFRMRIFVYISIFSTFTVVQIRQFIQDIRCKTRAGKRGWLANQDWGLWMSWKDWGT